MEKNDFCCTEHQKFTHQIKYMFCINGFQPFVGMLFNSSRSATLHFWVISSYDNFVGI